MQVLTVRNVEDAFLQGMNLLQEDHNIEITRNGQAYVCPEPVTTIFTEPTERVIFWEERDANPFFHFMEGLWMLAGRNDLKSMEFYNKRMREYSDDGEILWGAYGWRWREYFNKDQLQIIIDRLNKNKSDRRCVLQMWDAVEDLNRNGVDVPCNTHIYFLVRHCEQMGYPVLEMTVCNRSNDIIWGAYGANAVHLSMLQEYVASAIGVKVGKYRQISNNYHAYKKIYDEIYEEMMKRDAFDFYTTKYLLSKNPYTIEEVEPYQMVNTDYKKWTSDLHSFIDRKPFTDMSPDTDPFFLEVACPIQDAWYLSKEVSKEEALLEIQYCKATDWAKACFEWLTARVK
jgi:thymidylate synthase|tara:strand:- start:5767 stop:6795 length:1029 start_codon:yes stop_codon:yes gene_type:complete